MINASFYAASLLLCFSLLSACESENHRSYVLPDHGASLVPQDSLITDTVAHEVIVPYYLTEPSPPLCSLASHIRKKGGRFGDCRRAYRFPSDTLAYCTTDSIAYVLYPPDSLRAVYVLPDGLERGDPLYGTPLHILSFRLSKALLCEGITYCRGGQGLDHLPGMVDVWHFETVRESHGAEAAFIAASKFIFPNTKSYAVADSTRLFVFHATYNYESWQSKHYFDWFTGNELVFS